MLTARDLMQPAIVISPDHTVVELANLLVGRYTDGACVVSNRRLVGVVTTMDLISREKNVRLPSFFVVFDAIFPMGLQRAEDEMEKISATHVRDLMSEEPVTASPDSPASDVATLMVEGHYSMIPILDGNRLLGAVTRHSMVKALIKNASLDNDIP